MRIFWGRMFQAEKIPRSEVGMVLTGYFQMRGRSQEHLQPHKLGVVRMRVGEVTGGSRFQERVEHITCSKREETVQNTKQKYDTISI